MSLEDDGAPRRVLVAPGVMEQWASRDIDGNRLHWDWREPDADGCYTPVIRIDHFDGMVSKAAVIAFLRSFHEACDGVGLIHDTACWEPGRATAGVPWCELVAYVRGIET